jgi:hypothetical protein
VRLADRFYLTAHHDVTGKRRAHPRAVAYGLAAALIGELLYDGRLLVDEGHVRIIDTTPLPDALADTVRRQIISEPQHTAVPVWLEFLAQTSIEQVARRLYRDGIVRRGQCRRVLRTVARYVPTDMNVAAWSWIGLATKVKRGDALDPLDVALDVALAGLVVKTGLDSYTLSEVPPAARDYLLHLIANAWPPLRDLLMHTETAVAGSVRPYHSLREGQRR